MDFIFSEVLLFLTSLFWVLAARHYCAPAVAQVLGCGMQTNGQDYYRGVRLETNLLPRIKVEVVICKIPLDLLISTVKQALYTGCSGDGKMFLYDVENVIKVRTGEEGYEALQDEE